MTRRPIAERFWSKVAPADPVTGCRVWTAKCFKSGYGKFRVGAKSRHASRVAWELTHGPITNGLHVLHRCDNRPCCAPAHLFLGTHQDNVDDMCRKGRQTRSSGALDGNAELTELEVIEIRSAHARGVGYRQLAKQYGVGKTTVRHIIKRDSWRHI